MEEIEIVKNRIRNSILNKMSILPEVCSITFVGSFVNSIDISVVSDIDIIIVVNKINKFLFNHIRQTAETITGADCGLPDYQVRLNMSFGPLKFNDEKTIVFHLMVYDVDGHRNHVIESPFTCNDWQYFGAAYGKSLSEIYPATPLQMSDIIGTRRGLESYMNDLDKEIITYRNYVFQGDIVTEEKHSYKMDERHKKEYAYHVVKFLMLNLLKILKQENIKCSDVELCSSFQKIVYFENLDLKFFLALSSWKQTGKNEPKEVYKQIEQFVCKLNLGYKKLLDSLPKISFFRHGKTELNDGSFLGVRRDPEILDVPTEIISNQRFDIIYTGTLKRTRSTGLLLNGSVYFQNSLINEIDYGLAEALTYQELKQKYPSIIDAWAKGEDPNFPDGENQYEVFERLNQFVNEKLMGLSNVNIAVVTHNVVIRTLLAKFYQVPVSDWYRLCPDHLEQISFRIFNGALIPQLTKEQRIKFRDQLLQWI